MSDDPEETARANENYQALLIWKERAEMAEAKVARAIEWARVEAGELGAEDLRAALAEPERDEESGR